MPPITWIGTWSLPTSRRMIRMFCVRYRCVLSPVGWFHVKYDIGMITS